MALIDVGQFDGVDDRMALGSAWSWGANDDIEIRAIWTMADAGNQAVISSASNTAFRGYFREVGAGFRLILAGNNYDWTFAADWEDGEFHTLRWERHSDGTTIEMFFDGGSLGTDTGSSNVMNVAYLFGNGNYSTSFTHPNATVDYVRLYSAGALDRHFDFSDQAGTTISDIEGSNDATLEDGTPAEFWQQIDDGSGGSPGLGYRRSAWSNHNHPGQRRRGIF